MSKIKFPILIKAFPIFTLLILCASQFSKIQNFFHYASSILAYPFVWALTENENMLFIHAIISGHPLYNMENTKAFLYPIYPPIFHLISALFVKFFGFNIFIPRLISLLSLFILALTFIYFFMNPKKRVENTLVTVFLLSISLSLTFYAKYFILARVDMLSNTFAFLSLYLLWRITYLDEEKLIYYVFAGFASLAALLTKQSLLFPYLLIVMLVFFVKNRRKWVIFSFCTGILTCLVLLVTNVFSRGGFIQNMILGREIYGKYLNTQEHLFWLNSIFYNHFWSFILGAIFLIFFSLHRSIFYKRKLAFSLIALVSIYINFLIVGGNRGADHNTLIPLVFGILLVMKELYFFGDSIRTKSIIFILFISLSVLQLINSNA